MKNGWIFLFFMSLCIHSSRASWLNVISCGINFAKNPKVFIGIGAFSLGALPSLILLSSHQKSVREQFAFWRDEWIKSPEFLEFFIYKGPFGRSLALALSFKDEKYYIQKLDSGIFSHSFSNTIEEVPVYDIYKALRAPEGYEMHFHYRKNYE